MATENLLVYLDRGAGSQVRLEYCCALAARLGWFVTAMFAHDAEAASYITSMVRSGEADAREFRRSVKAAHSETEKAARRMRSRFQDELNNLQLAGEWCELEADIGMLERNVLCASLVCVGPTDSESTKLEAPKPEKIALLSGRPVLIVPKIAEPINPATRAVIAWNGRKEAVRALFDAMPLLQQAKDVLILTINEKPAAGLPSAAMAASCLQRHGVTAKFKVVTTDAGEASSVIFAEADSFGCDLLVMGAYGNSRAREALLGGVTRDVLASVDRAVLISH
jgi:nucleotide-binding universal stress UspA family protein